MFRVPLPSGPARRRRAVRPRRFRPVVEEFEPILAPSTFNNFDDPGSTFNPARFGTLPGPTVTAGGPTGNFLRLATSPAVNVNSITFNATDPGEYGEVEVDFDFRMIPLVGRADGFGFALLNTNDAEYGTALTVGGGAEEPSFRASLGIGFDIHQGPGEVSNNHLSVYFNEAKVADFNLTPLGVDLASGQFIHARIVVRFGSSPGAGDVRVVLTPSGGPPVTAVDGLVVNGLIPYPSRLHFMGRSGFEEAHHDLDSISAVYKNPAAGALALTSARYTVVESQTAVTLAVVRTGGSQGPVSVRYATSNGTAVAGSDFVGTAGTILSLQGGETSKTFTIPILNDAVAEGEQTFAVTLSDPTGGPTLGATTAATVTIFDVEDQQADQEADQVGDWGPVLPSPVVPIHMSLLPTGEVLLWDRHGPGLNGDPHLWNPATGTFTLTDPLPYDIFCAGHVLLPDGRLFVAGGHIADGVGEKHVSIYDPYSLQWTTLPPEDDMNDGRWYPTATVLPNGDVLVQAGTAQEGVVNPLAQVWQTADDSWRTLTGAAQGSPPEWPDFYPWTFVAPDGRAFVAGPQQTARYLDPTNAGSWTDADDSELVYRDYGSAVTYAPGKVLIVGGNPRDTATPKLILPSDSAQVVDLNAPPSTWADAAPMTAGRRHLNTVLLPDGTVLVVGGSSATDFDNPDGAVLHGEVWDPATNQWTPVVGPEFYMGYHSNALLLPDGRVLATRGGHPPLGGPMEMQLYSPAYLFRGDRPAIVSAPTAVGYGQTFRVETPDAASVTAVTWVRLPSVTHAFNQSQGINPLTFTVAGDGLDVTAPADGNAAPPGHYMLFILRDGVPSVARIVQITEAGVAITESGGATAVAEGGPADTYTVALTSAPTADVTVTLSHGGRLQAEPVMLTFTPGNWDVPQTVTVRAVDDTQPGSPPADAVRHGVASTDPRYDQFLLAPVRAVIGDNDVFTPPITVIPATAPLPIQVGKVLRKVKGAKRVFFRVTRSDGSFVAELRSPFQGPNFQRILAVALDRDGDGHADSVRVMARRKRGGAERIFFF